MAEESPPLRVGLHVRHKDRALERVDSHSISLSLLAARDGAELIEGELKAGERITLVPPEGDPHASPLETYYVLSGELRGGGLTVGTGDCLVADVVDEPTAFVAQGDTRFLYVSSRPFFHGISNKVGELMRLADEVERRDGYTADHCLRIQRLSYALGQELGLSAHRLYLLEAGSYLHDLGKARIPAEILQKPGKLDEREWALMRRHPSFGREMIEPTYLRDAGPIIEQHHERIDGSGYPFGLERGEVLPEASIVAIADTYDAITTRRAYREARSADEAIAELERYAGVHWPREFVRAFQSALPRIAGEQRTSVAVAS